MAFAPGDSTVPVSPPPAAPASSAAEDGSNLLLELAWQFVEETDAHLFLTGRAGTGKTTFLRRLRESCPKRMVVAAPTGVAAINAGGVTLHSFFQLPLGPFIPGAQYEGQRRFRMPQAKRDLIRSMDLLVIDEISMVRADLLDAVDDALRRFRDPTRPFGGVQLLLIGDLQQLPPVVTRDEQELFAAHYSTPYFFSSRALAAIDLVTIELHHVYRQSADPAFLSILNAIRSGSPSSADLVALNARVDPAFRPPPAAGYIRLTSHNALADAVNARELDALPSPPATYRAALDGDFPETSLPTDRHLVLKPGAQVMFVKNDPGPDHRFYNGLIGTVRATAAASVTVDVPGQSAPIRVEPLAWENKKYSLDPDSGHLPPAPPPPRLGRHHPQVPGPHLRPRHHRRRPLLRPWPGLRRALPLPHPGRHRPRQPHLHPQPCRRPGHCRLPGAGHRRLPSRRPPRPPPALTWLFLQRSAHMLVPSPPRIRTW